jgi:secretion/DNA translocation related CpaE-like protein
MRVVLITHETHLADEVVRLAAAAGVQPDVLPLGEALAGWSAARVVLVGVDLLEQVHALAPPRRDDVHVVGLGRQHDAVFRSAVGVGAHTVAELPASQAWLVELLTDLGEAPARGLTVGVMGGAGGVGATTLACALAQVGAESGATLLLDVDTCGPGADRVLGLEAEQGVRWADLARSPGRLSARALRESVPRRRLLGVLTWGAGGPHDVDQRAGREVLAAACRGHDLVVADLGRHLDGVAREVAARCERVLVVTPATVLGLAATSRLLARLEPVIDRIGLVLRPGPVDEHDVEVMTGRPVLAVFRDQRGLAEAIDLGMGPVRSPRSAAGRTARDLLAAFA